MSESPAASPSGDSTNATTVAPTENKQVSPLTPKHHALISVLQQSWMLRGALPTRQMLIDRGLCTGTFYDSCITNPAFLSALTTRGIDVSSFDENAAAKGVLTELQLVAANTMLDLRDNRSQKKKLKELGVSTAQWEGWLRDPTFQAYLRTRAENLLGDNLHESHLALIDRVRSGDVAAIKYYNEITGRYVPERGDKIDVNAVLIQVLEIIQRHTTPEVAKAIAEDMLQLASKPIAKGAINTRHLNVIEAVPESSVAI